jgi:hypothetical protein
MGLLVYHENGTNLNAIWHVLDTTCYFTKTTCACLVIWEPVGERVRLVHHRTWFKPQWQNCDHSKRVSTRILIFVKCGVYFTTGHSMNHSAFWLCGEAVWGGCVFFVAFLDITSILRQRRLFPLHIPKSATDMVY